ncbi:GntR family transcriptional regulator [Streptomyces sp. GMY02]|uniref:GntR family transcriptional regulator n=1 Tax=Streptomyces sp. GMY02 TaxID=1333528 RepID=UPI001C2BFFC1|nr:GntR family transcriptional regulator [Streptomyces sp. GMY02]QXE34001.1 GntR family transcriptional regulator [Streptomyces sp. GMY02]
MPKDIERRPIYKQLADQLAEAITSGEFPPGAMLPSETRLVEQYAASRLTIRAAIAELRNMGLVESQHGRGSFVRQQTAEPAVTISRTVRRTGRRFETDELHPTEAPTVTRAHLTGPVAALLDRDEGAALCVDRLLSDPSTGVRSAHRTVIPMDVAEKVPELAESPDAEPAEIYAALTAAGHTLTFTETVTARAPFPDERGTLAVSEGAPVLITRRVTADAETSRPLICEELRVSAAHAQLAFQVTPEKIPAKRRA